MKILIATKNPGKFKEIREMLGELEADHGASFHSPDELGIEGDFDETGETFEENALGKAQFFAEAAAALGHEGLLTVADDSGIFIEALADELGLKTRRWGAGHDASDEDWLAHFMQRMEVEENRRAKFVCASALVLPDVAAEDQVFLKETCGEILRELEVPAKPGIPLSSVFLADGSEAVYAALDIAEKNRLSHRGRAFAELLKFLKNSLDG